MLPSPMDCRNFTLAARPHKTKSYATFSQHVHVHVHVHLPSRQDAQPPVPWRHTVEGADFNRSHNKKLLQNLNRQELLYTVLGCACLSTCLARGEF